ncbi:pyridoxamine 5'-phosphate oxidase family protein [Phenylobacterium conjunctum]|uniref:Pyridoxamine 5'-phosphate oxidase family protein n=1 Tax=Phenylobacterium conjunctum TaxID=1298959 RepID=A0ABW3T391_9CAUL
MKTYDQAEAQRRLWDQIEHHQTAMLGLDAAPRHTQPMTAFLERDKDRLWFFTRSDTDLARAVGDGRAAHLILQTKEVQAVVHGWLTLEYDRERIDRYWNAVVAAWYPDGKDDPSLTLLRLDCEQAEVWISEAGPIRFAWEIARANATGERPDLGGRKSLDFH